MYAVPRVVKSPRVAGTTWFDALSILLDYAASYYM